MTTAYLCLRWRPGFANALAIALALSWSATARATTYNVNDELHDTHDMIPGDNLCKDAASKCTLRAAIEEANAHPGFDAVQLLARTYNFTIASSITVTDAMNLLGFPDATTIDAKQLARPFLIQAGAGKVVYFTEVTITGGKNNTDSAGAVFIVTGSFQAFRIKLVNNVTANRGGAVSDQDQFVCTECTISGNSIPFTICGGQAATGGGLQITNGSGAWLYKTTFSGNSATRGGAIGGSGYLEAQNLTISNNSAVAGGGGLFLTGDAAANWRISYSTIAFNHAHTQECNFGSSEKQIGGGIYFRGGRMEVGKSVVALNDTGSYPWNDSRYTPDVATDNPTSGGPEIISVRDNEWGDIRPGERCRIKDWNGGTIIGWDRYGFNDGILNPQSTPLDPLLDALGNYGGYVLTHRLQDGSVAINDVTSGNPSGFWLYNCPPTDPTLKTRPQGPACDSGAFELR